MKPLTAKYSKRAEDLELISERVIDKTENNPSFPNPPAALAELKKELPIFRTARKNAEGGDKEMVSIKNDKKAIVLNLLQIVADFVTVTSKGDRTLILNSGFDVPSETNSTRNQPPSIEKLEVELGQAGEATTRIKNAKNAKAYVYQYTTELPGLNTVWTSEFTSQGSHTFQGLSSVKQYWFRVVAIGFNGQKGYSPIVSRVIQ
jgi:hypothetical protein